MPKPRQVAVAVPLVLPWLLGAEERTALELDASISEKASREPRAPLYLLCSSRKHTHRYLLPKGGIEKGESAEVAAVREAWEEAGLRGIVLHALGSPIDDTRALKLESGTSSLPKATYHFVLVLVTGLSKNWPERHERNRKWCTSEDLPRETSWKEETTTILEHLPTDMHALERLVKTTTGT